MEPTIGRLAFIGAGAMGTALMKGWLAAGLVQAENICAVEIDQARREQVQAELGVSVSASIPDGARDADLVVIAVKPQQLDACLPELRRVVTPACVVISIAAGVPLAKLEGALGPNVPVIRVMPNTPCLVGASASAMSAGQAVSQEQLNLAQRLFAAVGLAYVLPEKQLDAVTGLSGSGPAYVYLLIEALSDGGVMAGLPRDVARALAAQTVLGAARMVLETGQHPAVLREMVTSPAGTTATGLAVLEEGAVRGVVARAVVAAAERSRALGGN